MRESKCGNAGAVLDAGPSSEIHTTLLRIHSVFERLIYIASLANHGAGDDAGEEPADSTLGQMLGKEHQAVLENWLCLKLRDKIADLDAFAADQGRSAIEILRHWIQPRCHQRLIPAAALRLRGLFELELEILLPIVTAAGFTRD